MFFIVMDAHFKCMEVKLTNTPTTASTIQHLLSGKDSAGPAIVSLEH